MKKIILALAIGMLIGSTVVALAASNNQIGKEVNAVFASFNLVINGETKELETVPLVYNGTSYLPVKEIGNLTGYDVTYKSDSRTIELNSTVDKNKNNDKDVKDLTTETIKPEKLVDVDRNVWALITDLTDNYGITYAARPNGESLLKKGSLVFTVPSYVSDWPANEETSYTDGTVTIRVKFVARYIHFNIEDLKTAGFIE